MVLSALTAVFLSTAAYAEVYTKEELIKLDKPKAGGGVGMLSGEFSFTRDQALKEHAIKEIGWMTLKPGDSIGYHKHVSNEDAYIIVSGVGVFQDKDGKEINVKAGDITLVRAGEAHGLKNTGKEPLIFLDVIAEQ